MKFNTCLRFLFSSFLVVLTLNISWAQKPSGNNSLELIPDETEASIIQNNMRINPFSGVPMALYKPNYPVFADTPERMAKQFLTENHELFKLSAEISE